MPIKQVYQERDASGVEHPREELTFEGRVVKVRTYTASRNHSDTLDYSDFRSTTVTEALVWVGREVEALDWVRDVKHTQPVEPKDRFKWVDCTNLFVWRGSPARTPKVDVLALAIPELFEDLEAWLKIQANEAQAKEAAIEARRVALDKARADDERNRPVIGKQMVVAKGRKVKVGTVGTVAFVSDSGRVLLKDDDKWQDRKSDGTWVAAGNLKARA